MRYRFIRENEGGKYEIAAEGTSSGVFAVIWSLDFKFVTFTRKNDEDAR
jgi:hypothetical protein